MQITHLGHAAVLIETGHARILIDPGAFSDGWHGLTGLDAVLVTHQHPDHLDPAHVPALIAANPQAQWLVEPGVVGVLAESAPDLGGVVAFAAGGTATIGDVDVAGVGGTHASIHPDVPRIGNTGMVLRGRAGPTFFHPGDAYDAVPEAVDVLAVPLSAPWTNARDTIEFARTVGARQCFPIHDGMLNRRGREVYLRLLRALVEAEVHDLDGSASLTV